jgi:Ser/Thr protein kinase RdoA (MazF antagonist)
VDSAEDEIEADVARVFADGVSHEAADVMRAVLQRVREAQQQLGNTPHTFGLIHADIHQWNYLFNGREVRLIDFGDCGWGHYLYDLAVTVHQLGTVPHLRDLRAALLAGYRQFRDLSPAHEALIDRFMMLREVQDLTWFLKAQDDPSYRMRAAQIRKGIRILEQLLGAGP